MANDDFDLDDFDFEDFDIDIPDFEVEAASDDRKPVEKLRSGFFQGAKDHVTSVDTLEQSLKLALPEGYSAAFNAKDTAISSIKELYHTAADELKPVTTAVKNSVKKISPKVKEKLPRFIQNKIDDIQNEVEFNQQSAAAAKRENEDSQIASVMQEIFRTQMEVEQERRNEENGQELVSRTIETNQRNSLIESANIVAKGMDRVVGYQDNILSKYHQKSLELQFRHYFVAKDLLDLTSVHQGKIEEALSTITKNTALPEAVKIEKSELAGQLIKERLLNSSIDGIAGFASRYRDKLMGNAKNFIGGVAGSIGMGASMASSMPEGIDKSTMAGEMFGGMAAQYATEWASRELGERIKGNDQIRRGNAKLLNIFSPGGMSRKISQWGRSETKGSGWLSLGVDMLKSLVPQFYANDKVRDNPMFSSDKPAIYDQLARRSITEVIPTYLSQIAHWTKATATGTIDGDMSVYSLHRGGMTTKSNMLEDVKRVIMPRRDNITAKNEIDSFVDKMFDGREISDEAKSALRRQILVDVASNQTFDPRRYSKFEGFKDSKGEESAIEELITLFRERFSVDEDGEYDADDTDTLMNRTENEQRFNRLGGVIPTPDGRIRALVDAVGMDSLRELGLIKRVNREDKIDPLILRIAKRAFDFGSSLLTPYKWAWDVVVGAKNYIKDKIEHLSDGYLRGEKLPRLRASIMKEGGYFDQATGKVIKSFKDVVGTVVDKNGNVIATAEEIRASGGFFNAIGDRIKERSSSLFKGIGKGIGGIGSGVASLAGSALNAYGSMFKAAGSAIGAFGSALTAPFGGFGFGFGGPQADKLLTLSYAQTAYQAEILKVLLEGRKGRGKNKGSSGVDESWRSMDLKGDDSAGAVFSNPLKGMKNPFSKLSLKNPLKGLSLPKGKLGELFKGKKEDLLAEKDKRMAQVLAMITENQLSIKDKLENAKKKVLGDSDGDGTRDGAWWTRKRKGNATTQTKAKEGEKKSGIFGLLSAAMPLVVSGLTFIGTKIAGLAKALGMAKVAGALAGALGGGPDVGGGKKGLLRKGAGLLGRGMWGAAKLAGTATLGIGGLAARAVGFAAFKAVPAIVGALGSVLSAPVTLGVAAAVGVGYLGYKIYKHYATDSGPIFRIRMNQYGFSPNDKSNLAKIAKLESIHWKHTAFLGGKVTINGRDINFQDIMEIFDIDLSDTSDENKQRMQTWMHWYENRFVPVYKVHAAAVKSLGESNDFESFESSIKPEKALEIIEAVKLSDMTTAFNDMVSPFEGEVLDRDAEAVKKAVDEGIAHYKEKLGKKNGTSSATTPSGVVATAAATTVAAGTPSVNSTGAEVTKATAFKEGLKKGLLAGAMVLAAPALIPAAIVGKALGLAGVDVKKLTAGQVVRLKAYGLTTLDSEKVNLLLEMEQKAIKDIKFDGQKQGIWAGVDDSYLDRYGSRFGVSTAEDKERWIRWFSGRFLPVLVQFATSVKTRANVPILDAESRIRGNTLRTVLSETIGATAALDGMNLPIWQVTDSPWSDYPLNTDRQSAEKTIESIEKVNDVHGDILGEDKKIKPKGVEDVDSTEEDKKGVLSKVMDKMKTAGQNALSAAKEKGTALWNGLTDKLAAARDKVVETIASVPGASSIMGKVGNPSENREAIINAMLEAGITDPKEQAAFMAQLDHESGGFKHVRENLNYSAQGLLKVFSKYYKSSALAQQEARNPEAIANRVYGGRMGNEQPGEGFKYRGRGFIQLTGKSNYVQASKALGIDLVNNPDMAEDPATAAKIAVWFWKKSGAGDAARAGDLRASRRAVNGGYNGMSDVQGKFNTYLSQALAGKFQPSGEKPGTSETGTAVASSESPTAAAPTDTTGGSTPPVATGLTTVASPSTPAAVTAPVAAPVAVSEPVVEAPQPSAKSPELRAKIADTQSSKIETLTDQHMSAMTSILEKQLSIQSSIDGRLAQVVQLLKNGAIPVPSSPSTSKDTPRTVSAPATPMPKSPVSMSRSV